MAPEHRGLIGANTYPSAAAACDHFRPPSCCGLPNPRLPGARSVRRLAGRAWSGLTIATFNKPSVETLIKKLEKGKIRILVILQGFKNYLFVKYPLIIQSLTVKDKKNEKFEVDTTNALHWFHKIHINEQAEM